MRMFRGQNITIATEKFRKLIMLENFPVDVILNVMGRLSADDISAVTKVSSLWRDISENQNIAKKIIERDVEGTNVKLN